MARLGGDEFAVLLGTLRETDDAVLTAKRILAAMTEPFGTASGESIGATLSIGVAVYPVHARGGTALLHAADAAMYGAKRQSGATWRYAEAVAPA
ncbi:Cyclic di-GMP phosphodiesterase Gmr [compost metagenome]